MLYLRTMQRRQHAKLASMTVDLSSVNSMGALFSCPQAFERVSSVAGWLGGDSAGGEGQHEKSPPRPRVMLTRRVLLTPPARTSQLHSPSSRAHVVERRSMKLKGFLTIQQPSSTCTSL